MKLKFFIILAIILIFILLAVAIAVSKNPIIDELPNDVIELDGKKYTITFFDDFDGEKLDKTKWELCPEQKRQDVGGKWSDDMISLDGLGNLVVSADIDENGTPISGAVRTKNKFEQARGYFEIRCKLQKESGFWGAFWLMTDDVNKIGNGARDGAEIDVFESVNPKTGYINHAVHWDGYGSKHQQISKAIYNKNLYDGEFHTFSLLWDETGYYFYIDGENTYSLDPKVSNFPGSSNSESYMKISAEFGSWAGRYNKNKLPDSFIVDYVKAYKPVE